ncbi:hypothetical protein [uncultured Thermomonospora sp.]|uniref:hypothetical protein n=1 Tax=uncultured Thermomonospora sp. TaxID=671175 RepID=UPI00259B9357|nr:hypothetical protein [uncultured Thermomonospora sp.]
MDKVVLPLGMGVDSVGVLTRFLLEPETRDFKLDDLIVMTAMTGDEFTETAEHMERFILPLMRKFSVRYVQLSRGGPLASSRYAVLDDSRQPKRMHMVGPWRLRDEQLGNGTVPQFAHGKRICSVKSKADPLEWWKEDHLAGLTYQHILGFSAEEGHRILKDSTYTSASRHARFPLAEWGWTRADTLGYLHEVFGTTWPRSCCVYCPFAASDAEHLADRWRREPKGAVLALLMERRAMALNPRATLFSRTSAVQFAIDHRLYRVLALAEEALRRETWALYDVRRIYHAAVDKKTGRRIPTKKGTAWRSVKTLSEGSRQQMIAELHRRARAHGTEAQADDFAIMRAQLCTPDPERFPTTERFLSVGPAGVHDKERRSFHSLWTRLADQTSLFMA